MRRLVSIKSSNSDRKLAKLNGFTGFADKNGNPIHYGQKVLFDGISTPYEVILNTYTETPCVDSELGQEFLSKCYMELTVVKGRILA